MTLPNIGLIGKLRSGKDKAAEYLAKHYGYTRYAFGDELKDEFHRQYPDIPHDPKPRAGYQEFGQHKREERGEDVWITACFDRIEGVDENRTGPAIITDCRQPNEYRALQSAGYVLIRIDCPDELRVQRAEAAGDSFTAEDLAHPTETALDNDVHFPADFTVDNSGSLDDLYTHLDSIMTYLSRKPRSVKEIYDDVTAKHVAEAYDRGYAAGKRVGYVDGRQDEREGRAYGFSA